MARRLLAASRRQPHDVRTQAAQIPKSATAGRGTRGMLTRGDGMKAGRPVKSHGGGAVDARPQNRGGRDRKPGERDGAQRPIPTT
jgi:hypothetical protein